MRFDGACGLPPLARELERSAPWLVVLDRTSPHFEEGVQLDGGGASRSGRAPTTHAAGVHRAARRRSELTDLLELSR